MRRGIVILLAGLLLAIGLQAATLESLSLDDMIQKSTAIVRGRVTTSYSTRQGSLIYTHYRVEVSGRWKGAEAAVMDVVVPGGSLGALRQTFSGAPKLAPGSDYLLFLWRGPSGLNHVIGLSQGVFDVQRDASGEAVAFRPATSELMLDSSGQTVRDQAMRFRLKDFRARVTRTLTPGGAR
jgi:hypothetical protein